MSTLDLWQHLRVHGPVAELAFAIDLEKLKRELEPFQTNWVQYNHFKPEIRRKGLSLTSLDGGLSGLPDLCSLLSYNRHYQTHYRETDFTKPTPVFKNVSALHGLLDYYGPFLGRCHFLKLGAGGFFPPHRDDPRMDDKSTFRIFSPLLNCGKHDFVFLFEDQRIWLEPGHVYFIDTARTHSVFSFVEDSVQLVLNVRMTEESLYRTFAKLSQK